ncbi:MAG: hypothetical protein C5B47_00875 [Verrucomicrobia bacterium]|nr:MAG: hypothetical protein C5B47_00875 [Verrucomicrobiota bacterium]
MAYPADDFEWGTFGGSPREMVSIMAPALASTWSNVKAAFSTLQSDTSNSGFQIMYQYYSNLSNSALQNTSQAIANQYDITKKILENTRA